MPVQPRSAPGLIPALPRDREEQEAYEELYPFLPDPADTRRRDSKS